MSLGMASPISNGISVQSSRHLVVYPKGRGSSSFRVDRGGPVPCAEVVCRQAFHREVVARLAVQDLAHVPHGHVGALPTPLLRVRCQDGASQLSICRPAIRRKSSTLLVASTSAFSIAVAAIRISASGINCPRA